MPKYSDKQKKTIDRVYRTLKKAGYDDHAIAGILGNAHTESQFDPDSIGKSHYGLFQNDGNIRSAIISKYGDYSLDSQLKYIMDWNDSWMRLYERPVIVKDGKVVGYQGHDQRLRNSMDALNYINATYNAGDSNTTFFPVDWDLVNKPQLNQPVLPKENPVPFENKQYQFGNHQIQPLAQQDVWNSFDKGAVAYGEEPSSPFRLQMRLPKLSELMAMDSPQEQLKQQIRSMLPMPNIQPVTNIFNV